NKVRNVFFNLTSAHTNDSIKGIARVISPELSGHSDNIYLNSKFYERVKLLYDQRSELDLSIEQNKLLENYLTNFVRAGAALNEAEQEQMRDLNQKLSSLTVAFG
ncbi:MAG: peptidase M3, partial [Marinoscillum sp.]